MYLQTNAVCAVASNIIMYFAIIRVMIDFFQRFRSLTISHCPVHATSTVTSAARNS